MTKRKEAAGLGEVSCCQTRRKGAEPVSTTKVYHVAQYLGIGEKNRVSSEVLCQTLGCNKRRLQEYVNADRKRGAWILSFSDGKGGYALAESQEQYENFCKWFIAKQGSSASFFRGLIKDYDVKRQEALNETV